MTPLRICLAHRVSRPSKKHEKTIEELKQEKV